MSRRRALLAMGGIKKPDLLWNFDNNEVREVFGGWRFSNNSSTGLPNTEFKAGKFGNALFVHADQIGWRNPGWADTLIRFPSVKFWDENGDLPFSISFWVNKEATNGAGGGFNQNIPRNTIMGLTGGGSFPAKWAYGISSPNDTAILRLNDDGNGTLTFTSQITITRNQWDLVQLVYDGNKGLRIFINNVEDLNVVVEDTGYESMKNGDDAYGLSLNGHAGGSHVTTITLLGGLDDIGIWNDYQLSQKDRDLIWNSGIGRKLRNI